LYSDSEEEEIVDIPGNDGNALMLEQVKEPNPWRKKKKKNKKKKKKKKLMMMMMMYSNSVSPQSW